MKIALTMDGNTLATLVSAEFDTSQYLVVVRRSDAATIEAIEPIAALTAECIAQKIIDLGCEGLITGNFTSESAFDLLVDACLTRFMGAGQTGLEALDLMKKRTLPFIRNFSGTDACSGDHH